MTEVERWSLARGGVRHVVEITATGVGRRVAWSVDEVPVAERTTVDDRVVLDGSTHGAIAVRLARLRGPARRVTWWCSDEEAGALVAANLGLGGVDLDAEAGTAAAEREAWIRAHPTRYALQRVAIRTAAVLAPVLLAWLVAKVVVPQIPWPDIPWPDIPLPQVPWPDIPWPQIPWPQIAWPDWTLPEVPERLRRVLRVAGYVWPVVLAAVLARSEITRRRRQDADKAAEGGAAERGVDS